MQRVHLLISGDVTGVGFRSGTLFIARELGLVGWVRNIESPTTSSGRVEIVAEGPRDKLENLATWARSGPPLARVTKINIKWEKATGEFTEFELRK